jgi:flagellar motor switch protein FliM
MAGPDHDQLMLVSRFQVDLSPGGGEFHLALPCRLFDGLRTFPAAAPRPEDAALQWRSKFVERVNDVQMRARAVFPAVNVSVADLIALAPGDFIAINRRNKVNVMVGNRVMYSAESTTSNGFAAVKVVASAAGQRG